jgi:hypothetical protein
MRSSKGTETRIYGGDLADSNSFLGDDRSTKQVMRNEGSTIFTTSPSQPRSTTIEVMDTSRNIAASHKDETHRGKTPQTPSRVVFSQIALSRRLNNGTSAGEDTDTQTSLHQNQNSVPQSKGDENNSTTNIPGSQVKQPSSPDHEVEGITTQDQARYEESLGSGYD